MFFKCVPKFREGNLKRRFVIGFNIAIKRSSVLRQPTKLNLDGEVCKTSESLNRCYIPSIEVDF